jgi:hypothetical protein
MDVRYLELKTLSNIRKYREGVLEGNEEGAKAEFDSNFFIILSELENRNVALDPIKQRAYAYKTARNRQNAKQTEIDSTAKRLADVYGPVAKARAFYSDIAMNQARINLFGLAVDDDGMQQTEMEMQDIISNDTELGPQIAEAYEEFKAVRPQALINPDEYLPKEEALMDLLRQYGLKKAREMQKIDDHNFRTNPRDFVGVMADTISEHVNTSLGRLGLFRAMRYRLQLN